MYTFTQTICNHPGIIFPSSSIKLQDMQCECIDTVYQPCRDNLGVLQVGIHHCYSVSHRLTHMAQCDWYNHRLLRDLRNNACAAWDLWKSRGATHSTTSQREQNTWDMLTRKVSEKGHVPSTPLRQWCHFISINVDSKGDNLCWSTETASFLHAFSHSFCRHFVGCDETKVKCW